MIQEIIVYAILTFTVGIISFNTYNIVRKAKARIANPCGGCSGCDLKK
ncbi:MAG: FeoB-associated Cys-rich membrane protein [Ignavibacteriales bacterium]